MLAHSALLIAGKLIKSFLIAWGDARDGTAHSAFLKEFTSFNVLDSDIRCADKDLPHAVGRGDEMKAVANAKSSVVTTKKIQAESGARKKNSCDAGVDLEGGVGSYTFVNSITCTAASCANKE